MSDDDAHEGETLEARIARLTASRDEWAGHAARWKQRAEESAPDAALWEAHQAREAELAPRMAELEAQTRAAKEELFALRLMWEHGVPPSILPLLHGTEEERLSQARQAMAWAARKPRPDHSQGAVSYVPFFTRADEGRAEARRRSNPQENTHAR